MVARRTARPRDVVVTPLDIELLSALDATGSIVQACAQIKVSRDTGMYRLRRLSRAVRGPVAVSVRGGSDRGGTRLTDAGRQILRQGVGPLRTLTESERGLSLNVLRGIWHSAPQPRVTLDGGVSLFVTFMAREGEPVRIAIEPDTIVVARSRFESSARNVVPGTVETLRRVDALRSILRVRFEKNAWLEAAITPRSQRLLGLKAGAQVFLYLKATAVSRLR